MAVRKTRAVGGNVNEREAHQKALDLLEIDDVFVVESSAKVDTNFVPSASVPQLRFQHRLGPTGNLIVQERLTPDQVKISVVRYFVSGGIRVLRHDVTSDPPEDAPDDQFLAQIHATLAVDYRCQREFDPAEHQEPIAAFLKNAVFHAWSIWRAHVLNTATQMRLPALIVPIMKPIASAYPSATLEEHRDE